MAQVIWTEPALQDLDTIADYIGLDKPEAARKWVQTVFSKAALLKRFPKLGSAPRELPGMPYRQLLIAPCRIFYRIEKTNIYILFVMRQEQLLRVENLTDRKIE